MRNLFTFHLSGQVNRAPSCITVIWEDKCHPSKCPTLFFFPSLYAQHDAITVWDVFWSVGVNCPNCASSQLPMHPQRPHQCGNRRCRKALHAVQAPLSNSENISILLTLFSAQIQNILPQ